METIIIIVSTFLGMVIFSEIQRHRRHKQIMKLLETVDKLNKQYQERLQNAEEEIEELS